MATVTIAARSRKNGKSYVVQYLDPDTGRKKHHASFRRRDMAQQEANKDIFWLKDESLEDLDNLPSPDVIAAEIVENLESALEQFRAVSEELNGNE